MKPWLITNVVCAIGAVLFVTVIGVGVSISFLPAKPHLVLMPTLLLCLIIGMWRAEYEQTALIPAAIAGVLFGISLPDSHGLPIFWGGVMSFVSFIALGSFKFDGVVKSFSSFFVLAVATATVFLACFLTTRFASYFMMVWVGTSMFAGAAFLFYFQIRQCRRRQKE